MKRTLFVGIAVLLVLAAGVYVAFVRPALLPSDDTPRAERALVTSDLVLLGGVNVREAVFLEKWFLGSPILEPSDLAHVPAVPDRSLLDHLRAAGVAPRADLDQVFFAVYRASEAASPRAIVLLGRFDPAAIGGYLTRELKAASRTEGGRTVYEVTRPDPATCEPSAAWAISVDPGWILAADATSLTALLPRMTGAPHDADATLGWWQPLAHADVLALGIVDPSRAGSATTQPFLQAASQSWSPDIEGVEHAYLGLGVSAVPPQGRLRLVVDAADATRVGQRLRDFRKAVDDSRARWAETMPTVAKLYESLDVRSDGSRTTIGFAVDRTLGRNLQQMMEEIFSALLGGLGMHADTPAAAPPAERIDPSPTVFRAAVSAADLPSYDPHAMFAEEVEAQQGPFGIRIDAVRLPSDATVGVELAVAAFSGAIPNVVDGDEALLFVDSVQSTSGRELLRTEECGKDRNTLPAKFSSTGSTGMRAEKTVRLVAGADPRTIRRVSGHVELHLPTRTETVSIPTSGHDGAIRRYGATFALSKVEGGSVGYRIGGESERVLQLTGLNRQGKPLSSIGGYWGDFLFGEGRAGQKDYAGTVERVDVVFASELQTLRFPFALGDLSMMGRTDHPFLDTTPAFRPYGYKAMRADRYVANAWKRLPPPAKPEPHQSTALLEPFELSFDRAQAFYALKLDFTLRSPALPNFERGLSVGQFYLTRIELKDGTVLEPPTGAGAPTSMFTPTWEKPLEFGAGPRDGVLATSLSLLVDSKAKPEDLEALAGVLTVHFPTALETVRLDDLTVGSTARHGDSAITVMERGHRRLTLALDRAGDAIAYIRLLDAQGQAIAYSGRQTTGDGGQRFELMPMSPYERAEVVIATARDTKAYPFVLTLQPRKD